MKKKYNPSFCFLKGIVSKSLNNNSPTRYDNCSVGHNEVHLHNPVFTNQKKALSLQDKTKRHGSHEGIVEDAVTR